MHTIDIFSKKVLTSTFQKIFTQRLHQSTVHHHHEMSPERDQKTTYVLNTTNLTSTADCHIQGSSSTK